jgi:hypothetical protein
MASFDVDNLCTNIPVHETINICLNELFSSVDSLVIGLNRKFFKTLLEHSVLNSFFMFDKKMYKQIDGLGMGLPLGPTFANIFMCHHEKIWLDECPNFFKPIFYQRYIDDTFVLFKEKDHAQLFLTYLNNKHNNINFTMETEHNDTISFLDVNITKTNNAFVTSVYRKPSFSGLGTSFFSYCSFNFKVNSIKTLLYRCFHISSNYTVLHNEFEFLKQFFINNGYPLFLVTSKIKQFLAKRYENVTPQTNVNNIKYFSVPYFGPQSDHLKKELLILFQKYLPDFKCNIVLINNFTIGSFFKFKDSLPPMSRSSVIYKYTCPSCGSTYVGSTSRTLSVRVAEHQGRSYRTGAPLASPAQSSIRSHTEQTCTSSVNINSFNIIDYASDSIRLRILESLHILKLKPSINDQNSASPLYLF